MSQSAELDDLEERAYDVIQARGSIYQSELWKELEIDSRKASRIVGKLEDRGIVEREDATHEGHTTYLIKPTQLELDYSLLLAGDMLSPFAGAEDIDPIESDAFTQWILELAAEE